MMPESSIQRTSNLRGQVLVDELIHRQNLEKALASKCRECDYLYEQLIAAESDVHNFREAAAFFHSRLAEQRRETTHLKRQRRILAGHVRDLLYLARSAGFTALPIRQCPGSVPSVNPAPRRRN